MRITVKPIVVYISCVYLCYVITKLDYRDHVNTKLGTNREWFVHLINQVAIAFSKRCRIK